MDPYLEKYRDRFLTEVSEQIEIIREYIPKFIEDSNNFFFIDRLFRAYHSLKGVSGFMGLTDVMEMTDEIAGSLNQLRIPMESGTALETALDRLELKSVLVDKDENKDKKLRLVDLLNRSLVFLEDKAREQYKTEKPGGGTWHCLS